MEVTILPMQAAHVDAVAALEKECFSTPWSAASVASELENPLSLWLVAEFYGQVAGYIGSQTVFDEADLMNLAIAPIYRRQGLASQLIAALCQQLYANGVRQLTLEVRAHNAPAIALYQKLGFQSAGLRPNYYSNPRENALILKKKLGSI